MKDWNSTEEQLRSWRLRQPSAQVERRLFSPEQPAPPAPGRNTHWQHGWLAGVATAAIALTTAINVFQPHAGIPAAGLLASQAISNASYAASLVDVQHNCWTAPIFGWTNDGELHSSIPSLELLKTNFLR